MVWRRIRKSIEQHGRAALVSVIGVEGSAPREVGARMVVERGSGFFGTIGGGRLEYETLALAEAALAAEAPSAAVRVWPLGPNLGQCCGGSVTILTETFDAGDLEDISRLAAAEAAGPFVTISRLTEHGRIARAICHAGAGSAAAGMGFIRQPFMEQFGEANKSVLLFGAGHVGRALALALSQLPFSVRWIDSRADQFPSYAPANATAIRTDRPEREIEAAPAGAFIVIMTHSHPLDYSIAAAALRRPEFGFVGLIGSATKRTRFASQAAKLGIGGEQLARLTCPIGLSDIKAKEPSIIAAGIVAQLLIERERNRGESTAPALLVGAGLAP